MPTFEDNLSGLIYLFFEDETDRLSRNVGKKLTFYAACNVRFLSTFRDNLSGPIFKVKDCLFFVDGTDRLS